MGAGSSVPGQVPASGVYAIPGQMLGPAGGVARSDGVYAIPGQMLGPAGGVARSDGLYAIPGQMPGPIAFDLNNNTQTTKCSAGFSWNGSNCSQNSAAEVSLSCHTNQVSSYNTATKLLTCSNPVASTAVQRFTNVNGFKSRKCRNVENFSQNMNDKCKARY
jgi:hypothetical protein